MAALRFDTRAGALALILLAHVLLAWLLAQGSGRLPWHMAEAPRSGLLFLDLPVVPPPAAAQLAAPAAPRHAASAPASTAAASPAQPAAPAAAEEGPSDAPATAHYGSAAGGVYGQDQPDRRAALAEQAGPAAPKEKWARFRNKVGSAYVPDCLHTDALKNQHTAEGDCQLCFKGLAAAPAVAVAKLKGQCK